MALDWNKEVSFGSLKKKSKKAEMPSKTTMNLMVEEAHTFDIRKSWPWIVLLIVIAALFVKFGIVDPYVQVAQKQSELNQQQSLLSDAESKLSGYDALKTEYESYGAFLNSDSTASVDAVAVLDLVDQQIAPSATVTAISLKSNTLTLALANASLETIGNLTDQLRGQPIVSAVSVSTAATSTTNAQDVTATMVITLKQAS